jgi:hypothetical protein
MDYFTNLRENLLECIIAIITYLNENKNMKYLNNYILIIIEYAQKVNESIYFPSYVRLLIINYINFS